MTIPRGLPASTVNPLMRVLLRVGVNPLGLAILETQDPRGRVRLGIGLRYRWVDGVATILPDDDAIARQRRIIRRHPVRALNAINVRVLGADLLSIRVKPAAAR